jgi:PAS domain S-box-containing protein
VPPFIWPRRGRVLKFSLKFQAFNISLPLTSQVSTRDAGKSRLAAGLSRSGRWCIALAAAITAVALFGRIAGIEPLARFVPGWPLVRPTTATGALLLAAAFGLILSKRRRQGQLLLAVIAVAAAAAMMLPHAEHLPGGALGIYPGTALLLITGSVALLSFPGERQLPLVRLLATATATLLFVALIGISFRMLLALPPLVDISLPSLLTLLLLTYAATVVRADAWLMQRLTSQRAGAVMTRRLLPAVLLLPLVIGWAEVAGEGYGVLDSAFGSVLQTVLTMVALATLVLWGARRLDRVDARRGEAERQAQAQREWLHVTISSVGEAVVATDPAGIVRLVNPAAEALVGRSSAELVGQPISEAFAVGTDGSAIEHPLLAVLRGTDHAEPTRELKLLRGGIERYVEVNVAPINSAEQVLLGGVMIVRDVSLRRQNEQALRNAYAELDRRVAERTAALERANAALHDSLALLRGVTESTPDLIVVKDTTGRVMMANPAQVKAIGKAEAEIVGGTDRDFLGEGELAKRIMENDRRVMSSQRIERVEEVLPTPEGPRTYLSTKSPLRDVRGNVIGVIGVATDISERKRMENELREAQRFTQGLVETAPIILYLYDHLQQRIVYATGMGLQALGYTSADLMALNREGLENLVHPDDLASAVAELRRESYEESGIREVEFRCRSRSGEWRWMHGRERPFEPGAQNRLLLGVTVDITDRKIAELEREKLMAAEQRLRLEAERANRAKDEFLAIVSHELRSPLNALRGWGFLLGSAKAPDASLIERATQAIKRNVDHQARLIEDLLDTSRIMSGKLNIERRPTNLVEVVQGAVEVVKPSAAAKRIDVQFETPRASITVDGDGARLHQVAVNLLSNAVKFTPEGGRVTVALKLSSGAVQVCVADTGAGIDAEFLPRVFDRFSQADTSTTRRHGGLGIGLALVRHLTELHGGKVSALSEGEGKGSTFNVDLPLPEGEEPTEPSVSPPEAQPHAVGGLSGLSIFSLDDDPDARDVIALTLRQAGANVRSLATGGDLIALLDRELPDSPPDMLLLDLAMPEEDGFTVLRRVRALETSKGMGPGGSIPALAVTAFTEVSRARVIEQGFSDHVSKPIDPAKLVASIRCALAAALRQERRRRTEGTGVA